MADQQQQRPAPQQQQQQTRQADKPQAKKPDAPKPAPNNGALAVVGDPRLPYIPDLGKKYELDQGAWRVLVEAIFPGAKSVEAVSMALAYCRRRNLDVFKRVVHIVPIYSKLLKKEVETIWPGVAELRTTAHRTGAYAGTDETMFGEEQTRTFEATFEKENGPPDHKKITVNFPEWAQVTVYRIVAGVRAAFPGPRVYWEEIYSRVGRSPLPNDRWRQSPSGMLEKCAEAAALRKAFPEELGDEHGIEEIGYVHDPVILARNERPASPQRQGKAPATDDKAADANGAAGAAGEAEDGKERLEIIDPGTGEVIWGDTDQQAYADQLVALAKKHRSNNVLMVKIWDLHADAVHKLREPLQKFITQELQKIATEGA